MKPTDGPSGKLAVGIGLIAIVLTAWEFSHQSRVARSDNGPAEAIAEQKLPSSRSVVGRSVHDRPIWEIRLGDGDYVVLMLATIHGNEAAGTGLLEQLAERVREEPALLSGCTLVLLPCVNPDGYEAGTRLNAQGVDLNRNFPAENRRNSRRFGMQALSEPEAVAIHKVLERWQPRQIVTLHEPLECVDFDGPGARLAAAMGARCPLPVKKLGGRPGSLGSYAGETLGIPIITLELPRDAREQDLETLWERYGAALVAAVEFRRAARLLK